MSPHPVEERARSIVSRTPAAPAYTGVPPWLGRDAGSIRGIGRYVDHTLLKPEATREQVLQLCDEAARFGVKAVCVNGCWVETCVTRLRGSGVLVATVVGFPLGAMTSAAKAAEAQLALASGAREVDMVIPIGHVKSGDWAYVEHDIRTVAMAAAPGLVKVILETAALEPVQIAAACLAARAGRGRLRQDLDRVSSWRWSHHSGGFPDALCGRDRDGSQGVGRDSNGRERHPYACGWSQPDRHFQHR